MDQGVKEGLGAAYPKWDTAVRLLAPTHFAKVDLGILPVADYLHIDLIEESRVLILLNP